MSYDVYLEFPPCDHCGSPGQSVFEFNLTHNVNYIIDECIVTGWIKVGGEVRPGRSWSRFEGMRGCDILPVAESALQVASEPARENLFREMEPENKWGTLESVREAFDKLIRACGDWPKATLHASG